MEVKTLKGKIKAYSLLVEDQETFLAMAMGSAIAEIIREDGTSFEAAGAALGVALGLWLKSNPRLTPELQEKALDSVLAAASEVAKPE